MSEFKISDLIEILTTEIDLLKKLHMTLRDEQQGLVDNDVEQVKRNVEKQIAILRDIAELEDKRQAVLRDLSNDDPQVDKVKLETLVGGLTGEEADHLQRIRISMREILEAIGTVNRNNGMLINQSLSYIDTTLKMIAGEDASSKVYTANGEITCRTGQIALNSKI
jgi:flagellar biosynthesis/type III secretory pathway chaperone